MTPNLQDSPAEGPPSKRTRSTIRISLSSTPQSQNNTNVNDNINTANWPSSQTSSLNTPDSCHTGNTPSLSACTQNTTRRATQSKSHINSRGILHHREPELTCSAIHPLNPLTRTSQVWRYRRTTVRKLATKEGSHQRGNAQPQNQVFLACSFIFYYRFNTTEYTIYLVFY